MSICIAGSSNQVSEPGLIFASFGPWFSEDDPTTVRPTCYSDAVAEDFLGNDTTQSALVSPISTPEHAKLTVYVSFNGDGLV